MPDEPSDQAKAIRIEREIGDDPAELATIAGEVIAGIPIERARIKSLRKLIEAVQSHQGAVCAPPRQERGNTWKPPNSDKAHSLTELTIKDCEITSAYCFGLDTRITLALSRVSFAGGAGFDGASFAGRAEFDEASFAGHAGFGGASFAGHAGFGGASFAGHARFGGASFAGHARFGGASFAGHARFDGASFAGRAGFDGASFAGHARFDGASFAGHARFDGASFAGRAEFDEASFAGHARFSGASFAGDAWFGGASIGGQIYGDLRPCYLRTATFGEEARKGQRRNARILARLRRSEIAAPPATRREHLTAWSDRLAAIRDRLLESRRTRWLVKAGAALFINWPRAAWRWIARDFGWGTVRALGQLHILNRVSVIALIAVPVLASITSVLQAHLTNWPALGTSTALLFFAAVFVTLGLLAYQTAASEEVRKFDEDLFIDRAHKRYHEDAPDRADGLRRAIEHLELIAERRPDRHANFVKHHGDTIWIPPRDRIEWFDKWKPPAGPGAEAAEGNAEETDGEGPSRDAESAVKGTVTGASAANHPRGMVPGEERRRITIEEGVKAEYWLKSRERWPLAWVSFLLYLTGIGCLLWILGLQAKVVAEAAGWIDGLNN